MLKTMMIQNADAFAASTGLIDASVERSVRELSIGLQGEQADGVIVATMELLDVLQPISVRLDGSPIVSIRGSDLRALNLFAFNETPYLFRSAALGGNRTRVHGLRLPLNQPPRDRGKLVYQFGYTADANVDECLLTAAEIATDEAPEGGYFHYVEIPHTLPAATGYGQKYSLAMPGDLLGILLWNTTIMAAAADVESVQEIKLFVDGTEQIMRTAYEMQERGAIARDSPIDTAVTVASPLDCYAWLNLQKNPIPAASKVEWQINAGVASDPIRVIPLYQVGGT